MSPFKTIVAFAFLAFIGLLLAPKLSIDLLPQPKETTFTLRFTLPHAPPETVEREATAPLENVLSQLSELKNIYSVSNYDQGIIELSFARDTDPDFKKFEILSILRQTHPQLNSRVSFPLIEQRTRSKAQASPLLVYRINGPLPSGTLRTMAEDALRIPLSTLPDVSQITLSGGQGLQVTVETDPDKLRQYGLNHAALQKNIHDFLVDEPIGFISHQAGARIALRVNNGSRSLEQLRNIPIMLPTGSYPLRQFARVYMEEMPPQTIFRVNAENSVRLSIYADLEVNRLSLAAKVKNMAAQAAGNLPVGVWLSLDYDDTEFIATEVNKNLLRTWLALALLSVLILITYRSKSILVLISALLITLSLTLLVAYGLGISIHLYSIAGLCISFGILIDNAIMALDQAQHQRQSRTAALITSTLCAMGVLSITFLLPDTERANLTDFSAIVCLAMGMSLLVAIYYVPAAQHLMQTGHAKRTKKRPPRLAVTIFKGYEKLLLALANHKKLLIAALILAFGLPVFLLPSQWPGVNWYDKTIGTSVYQEQIRPYTDRILGGALRLFVRNVFEHSGYRSPDKTKLVVAASLPYGHTLADMDRLMNYMEEFLKGIKGLENFTTQIYSGQYAQIAITFDKQSEHGSLPHQLKARLVARSLDWGGAEWTIYGVGRGFSNQSSESLPYFRVELRGYQYDELEKYGEVLAAELLKHKRIQKVNTRERLSWDERASEELTLHFDHRALASLQTHPAVAAAIVRDQSPPLEPDYYYPFAHRMLPVYHQSRTAANFSMYQLKNNYGQIDSSLLLLRDIATIRKTVSSNAIHKENRQYIKHVGFDYYGSHQFGRQYLDEVLQRFTPVLPAGFTAESAQWSFDWAKTQKQYGLLALVFISVYLISVLLFENLFQPLLILLAMVTSYIGIFLIFGWLHVYFDQGGYAAFFLLSSLSVSSAIYLINEVNRLPRNHRAAPKAAARLLRPIVLTVSTTIITFIPFIATATNEVFWSALSSGTIGGLLISLFCVFILLPVFMIRKNQPRQKGQSA